MMFACSYRCLHQAVHLVLWVCTLNASHCEAVMTPSGDLAPFAARGSEDKGAGRGGGRGRGRVASEGRGRGKGKGRGAAKA